MSSDKPEWDTATLAVHVGRQQPAELNPGNSADARSSLPQAIPTAPPIHLTTTFWYPDPHQLDDALGDPSLGFSYARYGTPTTAALEEALAALEGTDAALVYASGMAAIYGALLASGLRSGDTLLLARDVYGTTIELAHGPLAAAGIHTELVDATSTDAVVQALRQFRPRTFLFETISNPLLRVADGPALVAAAHEVGTQVVVDNTFATPLLVRPANWGADFVVHSTTKYLSGHGDVAGGAVCASHEVRETLLEVNKLVGAVASPLDSWLALRGLRTLPVRLARQVASARKLAERLSAHPGVARVHYPGLASHPDQAIAARLLREPGAMIALDLKGGADAAFRLLGHARIWVPGTSLGDCWSLVLYPAIASHRALSADERAAAGIGDGLVRLSVGLEDPDDLYRDLDQALGRG